jgi:hypothetical protein
VLTAIFACTKRFCTILRESFRITDMETRMRAVFLLSCALVLATGISVAADNEWTFETFIRVPYANTLFLARDSQNNVYGTTFNSTGRPAEVVAFKIANALGSSPQVTVFDRFIAPSTRGYAGVAVDDQGNVYLSADQGDGAPSFIKKYTPSLELDRRFGTNGVLASTRVRLLGLAAHRNYIICAVSWARFLVIDSAGTFLGMTPELPRQQQALIRDIDFIPATQEVVGVDRDSVYVFTGGTLNNLKGYTLRALSRGDATPQAGAAIYYSPLTDKIYYSIKAGHRLGIITRSGRGIQSVESSPAPHGTAQPADTVISSDGTTMFVSDLASPNIVRYRRGGVHVAVGAPKAAGFIAAVETASAPEAVATARTVTEIADASRSGALESRAASPAPESALASQPPPALPAAPESLMPPIAVPDAGTPAPTMPPLTVPDMDTPAPAMPPLSVPDIGTPAPPSLTPETTPALSPSDTPAPPTEIAAPAFPGLPTPPADTAPGMPGLPTPSTAAPEAPAAPTPPPLGTPAAPAPMPGEPSLALPPVAPETATSPTLASPGGPAATGTWLESVDQAFQQVAGSPRRVAIFFYTPESSAARQVEADVFSQPGFFAQHPNTVWVRVDVSKSPELMGKYGFFKVPVLLVFGSDQAELKRLEGTFSKEDVTAALGAGS